MAKTRAASAADSGGSGSSSSGGSRASGRSVATIDRATDVLFLFAEPPGSLGVTEISKQLDISKAVVHRILTSLSERSLVISDPETRRYSLGPAVLELAAAYRSRLDVRSLALDAMRELVAVTDETATFSVRHGSRRIYVDQVTPEREVKMTVQIGSAFPLHAGASSKAFLAWMTDAEIERYLAEDALEAMTDATITAPDDLRAELARIRAQGFAVSLGERQNGAASVAAPILDHNDEPVAVISLCGPLERFRTEVARSAAALVDATRGLGASLGATPVA